MIDEGVDVRVRYLRVTNNTGQAWTDSFDGVPVTIMPGQMQQIPLNMAAHFFGWHPDVKTIEMMHYLARRRGWRDQKFWIFDDPIHEQQVADELFEKFLIEPVTYKLVEERPARAREPVPALTDEDVQEERMLEPSSVKEHEHEEPRPTPYRGAKPQPRSHHKQPPSHGRKTEGD